MADVALYTAVSGMQAAMEEINARANNLANANSVAYKALEVDTKDTFYNQIKKAGINEAADIGERPVGIQSGTGSKINGIYRNLEQGAIKQTSNPLDIAIIGSGYFAVTLPNNVRGFTRSGTFQVNSNRQIVTSEGYLLEDGIEIPDNIDVSAIVITPQGQIYGTDPAGARVDIGQLQVFNFANERGLQAEGAGYFLETAASGDAEGVTPGDGNSGKLGQYQREMSNVKVANEFASFMAAQQAYDMSARMMRAVDEMQKELLK